MGVYLENLPIEYKGLAVGIEIELYAEEASTQGKNLPSDLDRKQDRPGKEAGPINLDRDQGLLSGADVARAADMDPAALVSAGQALAATMAGAKPAKAMGAPKGSANNPTGKAKPEEANCRQETVSSPRIHPDSRQGLAARTKGFAVCAMAARTSQRPIP